MHSACGISSLTDNFATDDKRQTKSSSVCREEVCKYVFDLRMHICSYQEAPSGLVVFMRPCFSDCSCTVPMNIQWARREGLPRAQEKRRATRKCA